MGFLNEIKRRSSLSIDDYVVIDSIINFLFEFNNLVIDVVKKKQDKFVVIKVEIGPKGEIVEVFNTRKDAWNCVTENKEISENTKRVKDCTFEIREFNEKKRRIQIFSD